MKNLLVAFLLLMPVAGAAQMPVPELPRTYIDTTFTLPTGTTWQAHTSSDFRNALNSANPGDTIVLDSAVTYTGNFTLPAKANPGQQWIYIVGSALANLPPPGTRVYPPNDAGRMPKIVTSNTTAAITLAPGANHYRLVGLEVYSMSTMGCNFSTRPITNCFSYQLIIAGWTQGQTMADSVTVDRCYLHGSPTHDIRQGILANASNFAVVDSYISDIHQSTFDSQAILAFATPGPIKVVNNHLSATTEDVMFGGAGGVNNPWVPSDIEVRNNHFFKPAGWAAVGVTIPPGNEFVEKNNMELKSVQRLLVDSNVFENAWVSGQNGYSVLLTVRTSQSGNVAVVDDVTFTNNILTNVSGGFLTGMHDNTCATTSGCTNPGEVKRVILYNNLVLFRDQTTTGGANNFGVMISPDLTDFIIQHNTFVPVPTEYCYESLFFNNPIWPPPSSTTHNLWILDNALCRQPTGNGGGQGTTGLNYYMSDPDPLDPRYYGNVMYVQPRDRTAQFPLHNDTTAVPFTYTDLSTSNYQLSIPDWTDTTDGLVSGVQTSGLPSLSGIGSN